MKQERKKFWKGYLFLHLLLGLLIAVVYFGQTLHKDFWIYLGAFALIELLVLLATVMVYFPSSERRQKQKITKVKKTIEPRKEQKERTVANKKFPVILMDDIMKDYYKGMPLKDIRDKYGFGSDTAIYPHMHKHGLKTRS